MNRYYRKVYAFDGNATLIQTSAGTWSITYNGANRPVRFRNEETDTTVDCGYDSQGRRYFKKVTVAGTANTFGCTMRFARVGREVFSSC